MKKAVVAAAVALVSLPALAQNMTYNAGKTTFGVRGGINIQKITGKDFEGDELTNQVATGFHVGVNAEVRVGSGFYVQPGVLYSRKGTDTKNIPPADDYKIKISYIEIPVNLVYKPVLGKGRMLLGFGPYAGFAVNGKSETADQIKTDIEFQNEVPTDAPMDRFYFKRMDAGANLLAGYEFANNLSFQINAQLGLMNISPDYEGVTNDKTKMNNTGFGLSVGYRF